MRTETIPLLAGASLSLGASAAGFITVATGETTGVYYPLGAALTQIRGVPGITFRRWQCRQRFA